MKPKVTYGHFLMCMKLKILMEPFSVNETEGYLWLPFSVYETEGYLW